LRARIGLVVVGTVTYSADGVSSPHTGTLGLRLMEDAQHPE